MSDLSNVVIISEGHAKTTRIIVDGKEMNGVIRVVISPINPMQLVEATITIISPSLVLENIDADVFLSS